MKICYVLLDRSNATSDIFYFTVEDNGKNPVFSKMSVSSDIKEHGQDRELSLFESH